MRQKAGERALNTDSFTNHYNRMQQSGIGIINKIILALILIVFAAVFYVVLDANKYSAEVNVIDGEGRVGVNPTTESLDFGDLSRGSSAVRRVDIVNGTSIPVFVSVLKIGGIADLMKLDHNNFELGGGAQTQLEFTTYIPASAQVGDNYTGRVFIFRIPTFGL